MFLKLRLRLETLREYHIFPCGAVYYCVFVVSTFVDYDANNEDLTDDDDEHQGRRCKKKVIGSITAAFFFACRVICMYTSPL